jgi:hypothetical protein
MFTVGVFKDVAWADRGIGALLTDGFDPASLSVLAKGSPDTAHLVRARLQSAGEELDVPGLGPVVAHGPLLAILRLDERLETAGLAAACARAGFQPHDGHIFQTLVERGGVLVAVESDARAADALARLHAYGGGNAAIGVHQKGPLVP